MAQVHSHVETRDAVFGEQLVVLKNAVKCLMAEAHSHVETRGRHEKRLSCGGSRFFMGLHVLGIVCPSRVST